MTSFLTKYLLNSTHRSAGSRAVALWLVHWIFQGFCPTFVGSDDVRLTLGGQRVWDCGYELGNYRKVYEHWAVGREA